MGLGWIGWVGGNGLKVAQRVDFGGVGCGRAWVISLPNFFLGNSFQFWKLPPGFCIKSRDNVYYHVFLTGNSFHFFIWKMVENGIKYAFPGRRTYVFSVDNFSGKAWEHVFCFYLSTNRTTLSTAHSITNHPQPLNNRPAHSTSTTRQALLFPHSTTRLHSIALEGTKHHIRRDFTRK